MKINNEPHTEDEAELPQGHQGYREDPVEKQLREAGEILLNKLRAMEPKDIVLSLTTILISAALVIVGAIQAVGTIRSANAAKSAADTARETLDVSSRPWVSADITQGGPLTFRTSGAVIPINFELKNVGRTPAINPRYHASILSLPERTWMMVELRQAERNECDSFSKYFFEGSPSEIPPIFPDQMSRRLSYPASMTAKNVMEAINQKTRPGPFRHPGFVSLYLIACVVYQSSYAKEFRHTAYGFQLGTPMNGGLWMGDLKPEGAYPNVRLIYLDSFAD